MARHIGPDDEGYVYRTVVEYEMRNGSTHESHFGPYTRIGAAKAMATRETTGRFGRAQKARVQRAAIEWEDVT